MRLVIRAVDGKPLEEELAYPFDQSRVVLGRSGGADVRIPHRTVSARHAIVHARDGGFVVEDWDSTNGTRVNDEKLVPKRARGLDEGDRLQLGVYSLSFHHENVVTEPMTVERTAEQARRLLRRARGGGAAAPRLVVLDGPNTGRSVELPPAPAKLLVGRDPGCALSLDDEGLSREHMELERDLDGVLVRNLESKNGVLMAGQPVQQRRLRDGDELTIGQTRLLFEDPAQESLDGLGAEPDLVLPPRAAPPPTATPAAPAQAPDPVPRATPTRRGEGSGGSIDGDWVIYGLAALVLVLSAVGLFVLFNAR